MRINKYIAKSGFCSRRKADTLIEAGEVLLNGQKASLGDTVKPGDIVSIQGVEIDGAAKEDIYLAFHKPVGVICTADEGADNTVFDYVDIGDRVFYLGRLDVASEGLMLFTNNGDVAENIMHAKKGIEKEYVVDVDRELTRSAIDALRGGIVIDDQKTLPARVKREHKKRVRMNLTEGRNRQIRKMFDALGYNVIKLRRVRVANVRLGTLGAGNWRHLTKKERRELLETAA